MDAATSWGTQSNLQLLHRRWSICVPFSVSCIIIPLLLHFGILDLDCSQPLYLRTRKKKRVKRARSKQGWEVEYTSNENILFFFHSPPPTQSSLDRIYKIRENRGLWTVCVRSRERAKKLWPRSWKAFSNPRSQFFTIRTDRAKPFIWKLLCFAWNWTRSWKTFPYEWFRAKTCFDTEANTNRPFPCSRVLLFQNESKYLSYENEFCLQFHFHVNQSFS